MAKRAPGRRARPARTPKKSKPAGRAKAASPRPARAISAGRSAPPKAPKKAARPARRATKRTARPVPTPPSSLNLDRRPSAARSGRADIAQRLRAHHETGPGMTSGDVDADWEAAYSVGDEAPGGDNPTPDQDVVEDIGRALGVQYEDAEELKPEEKIARRDRHRWELDPASAEDYKDRTKK